MGATNKEETPTFAVSAGQEGVSVENLLALLQLFIQQRGACDQRVVQARMEVRGLLGAAERSNGIDPGVDANPVLPHVKLDCQVLAKGGRRFARITVRDGLPKKHSRQHLVAQIWSGVDGCQHGSFRSDQGTAWWLEVFLEDPPRPRPPPEPPRPSWSRLHHVTGSRSARSGSRSLPASLFAGAILHLASGTT